MIFVDFSTGFEDGFTSPNSLNWRSNHIDEAIRYELSLRPRIDAPFRKMNVAINNGDAHIPLRPTICRDSILEVRSRAAGRDLNGPYPVFKGAMLSAIREAAMTTERDLGWPAAPLIAIIDDLERKEEICSYRLGLSKRRIPGGGKVDIIYRMTEQTSTLTAQIFDKSGRLICEKIVASFGRPLGLDFFFDARSTAIDGNTLLFRDREKKVIGSLDLTG